MPFPPLTRLGPYEILAPLGEGGMGEVYRARDTRLAREVAIKALPAAFAREPDRVARFEREAQLLASLNHPNIGVLYGVEQQDGMLCLVLELIEGESLAERLKRGPLPMDEAFDVAAQVATALEAAHEAGVVHRDLKPGNVMLRPDGVAKVLDFGLARGPAVNGSQSDLTQSPTMTSPATMPGMILGTAAYMSPEQAKGRPVDKRADLWAWGSLLYELLSGKRAFAGDDVSETIASILRSEPDWSALPAGTPQRVRELLARCLRKDPRERLRDAGDARVLLAEAQTAGETPASIAAPARGLRWPAISALIALGALAALAAARLLAPGESRSVLGTVRVAFLPPDSVIVDERASNFAVVSPDGRNLVFAGRTPHGVRMLWTRPLDSMDARPIPGTDEASEPFWSPDGRSIAFAAEGKLKRIDLAGGQSKVLADAARLTGGAWSPLGVIVFSPNYRSGLYRVPAEGGAVTPVCSPDSSRHETGLRAGNFLPDGRHFLYRVDRWGTASYAVRALDSGETKTLVEECDAALFAPPDWLLFTRRGSLFARRFDVKSLALTGEPILVPTGAGVDQNFAMARFSVSATGVLVAQVQPPYAYQLVWYDRAGRRLSTLGPETTVRISERLSFSNDRAHVVLQRPDPQSGVGDIWTLDVARGTLDRLTSDPGLDQTPLWAADGRSIFEATSRNAVGGIYRIAADGSGEQLFLRGPGWPAATTRDGRWLVYLDRGQSTQMDIWIVPVGAPGPRRALLAGPFIETQPAISADGHWLAYASNETGQYEVYVRAFSPGTGVGPAVRVSTAGGYGPRWRDDGHELFYVSAPISAADGELMAVPVRADGMNFVPGAPVALFPVHMFPDGFSQEFDVSADGQRFLVGTATRDPHTTGVNLVLNWAEGLK